MVKALAANPGELVGAGQPLVTIAAKPWQVETTELTELDVANVASGDVLPLLWGMLARVNPLET